LFAWNLSGCHRSANAQGKKISKFREFYFESGKLDILKKSLEKFNTIEDGKKHLGSL